METQRLAELIDEKHGILVQLRELAEKQTGLIDQADMKSMMSLLSARQTLLAEIQRVERQLDPFREQDPESRQWPSVEARQRTRDVAADCDRLLQEIMMIDKHSEGSLIHRRDKAAERLQGVHTASAARDAYTKTPSGSTGQLDLEQ